jgi:hypothetical protein
MSCNAVPCKFVQFKEMHLAESANRRPAQRTFAPDTAHLCLTVASFLTRRARFTPRVVHVVFTVNKVVVGHVFLWVFRFSSDN